MTWADIVFAATDYFLNDVYTKTFPGELLTGYSNLIQIVTRVKKIPAIKKWLETKST